jgi:hypothetical protein
MRNHIRRIRRIVMRAIGHIHRRVNSRYALRYIYLNCLDNVLNWYHSAAFFLVSVLMTLFAISIPLAAMLVFTYLFTRFVILVRNEGRAGIPKWATETKSRFIKTQPLKPDPDSDESETSGVHVKKPKLNADVQHPNGQD